MLMTDGLFTEPYLTLCRKLSLPSPHLYLNDKNLFWLSVLVINWKQPIRGKKTWGPRVKPSKLVTVHKNVSDKVAVGFSFGPDWFKWKCNFFLNQPHSREKNQKQPQNCLQNSNYWKLLSVVTFNLIW